MRWSANPHTAWVPPAAKPTGPQQQHKTCSWNSVIHKAVDYILAHAPYLMVEF